MQLKIEKRSVQVAFRWEVSMKLQWMWLHLAIQIVLHAQDQPQSVQLATHQCTYRQQMFVKLARQPMLDV